jgi:hypothetical protein
MVERLEHFLSHVASKHAKEAGIQALGWVVVIALLAGFMAALVGWLPD